MLFNIIHEGTLDVTIYQSVARSKCFYSERWNRKFVCYNSGIVGSGQGIKKPPKNSWIHLIHQSRGGEGEALHLSLNMAGFRGDVMCSWSLSGSELANDPPSLAVPVPEEQKASKRRRAFCMTRLKSRNSFDGHQRHPPAANNNSNMPFMIHCQIGKEIKHICSNCRGAEQLDGESTRFRSWREGRVEEEDVFVLL